MKKRGLLIVGVIVVAIVIVWTTFGKPNVMVATGYTAKYVCSATFLSDFSQENLDNILDLNFVRLVKYEVDQEKKQVSATLFGLAKQTWTYYENGSSCGCVRGAPDFPEQAPKAAPASVAANEVWPVGDQLRDSIPEYIDVAKLQALLDETLEANPGVLAAVVAYKDYLLAEEYQTGIDKDARILGWSMTKSVGNALFGIMEKNGEIETEAPSGIAQWQDDERKNITVSNLLQMSAGLKWTENYGSLTDATRMLFLEDDFVGYSLAVEQEYPADEDWYYSSGTSNILSGILRSEFDSFQDYLAFPYDSLFAPLGMHSAVIEMDNVGNHVLSSYCWATARDWTRFGLLYLYRGNWFGKQIFTEEWTDYTTTAASASDGKYGAQLWLNENPWRMPSVPTDAFYEQGFGGQRILIVPSKDLVVTVLSGNQPDFDFDPFYASIFACFDE